MKYWKICIFAVIGANHVQPMHIRHRIRPGAAANAIHPKAAEFMKRIVKMTQMALKKPIASTCQVVKSVSRSAASSLLHCSTMHVKAATSAAEIIAKTARKPKRPTCAIHSKMGSPWNAETPAQTTHHSRATVSASIRCRVSLFADQPIAKCIVVPMNPGGAAAIVLRESVRQAAV